MRNTLEIHNLVKLTKDVIQKKTIFAFEEDRKTEKKAERYRFFLRLTENIKSREFRTKLPEPSSDITAELPFRTKDPHQYPKEKLELDEAKTVPASVKRTHDGGIHKYPKEKPRIPKLGFYETQGVSGLTQRTGNKGVRTISEILFAGADFIFCTK